MSGVNKVILIGRLGADPDTRTTQTGQTVCTLSLATSESWVKDGKKEEKTEWHRVILWSRQAEVAAKYLKKGRMVYIEGKLQTRSWDDKQGQKRYTTEVVASNIQFIEGQTQNSNHTSDTDSIPPPEENDSLPSRNSGFYAPSNASNNAGSTRMLDDDIPF